MGKFKEIDRQRQEVEEVMSNENEITIQVYYTIDDETGIRHYETDSMREEFKKKIEQLEDNTQAEVDGWNEKQQDYAMDSMA